VKALVEEAVRIEIESYGSNERESARAEHG
jgi:hypothetical protein